MAIAASDFQFVSDLVRRKSGIVLEAGKEYLVEARLSALVRHEKVESIEALVARLRASASDVMNRKVVEAMTTNETSFFRDIHPFEVLRKQVIPALVASRAVSRSLSIWCAASSTGQEPYTIAMMLSEAIPNLREWKMTFVATDISTEMVARSRAGRYGQIEINRGLPAAYLVKYFKKDGLEWQVSDALRSMIEFRTMNLTEAWSGVPTADVVFMRNVLIYFDTATKREILGKARRVLKPDGYLFLGSAETTMGLDEGFERAPFEKSGCYRVRSAVATAA
jgi:chemotaxis protein methyltransferase CheR